MEYKRESAIVPIEQRQTRFAGHVITAMVIDDSEQQRVYVPLRPICKMLGIAWSGQRQRVLRDTALSKEVAPVIVKITGAGQEVSSLCLPLALIPTFLSGISVNRLTDRKLVSRLARCQRELTTQIADLFFDEMQPLIAKIGHKIEQSSREGNAQATREAVFELAGMLGIPVLSPISTFSHTWHIYIAKLNRDYKIGYSRNTIARMNALRRAGGAEQLNVQLIHSFPADRPRRAERRLHERFAEKRTNGEWFHLTDRDVTALKSITAFSNGEFIEDRHKQRQKASWKDRDKHHPKNHEIAPVQPSEPI